MRAGNDLGSGRIGVLVGRIALPSMLAQFISVLYSIVDRIFIGQIPGEGALALAGAGVCGPVVTMVGSVAFLVGVGGAPLLSIKRGEGDDDAARGILANCFLMLCVFSVALPAAILPFREPMLRLFGASDATYSYAEAYFTLYLLGTPFALLASGLNQFIVCQGFAADGMKSVALGAVLNIVLDPVFIFAFGLGVRGAAKPDKLRGIMIWNIVAAVVSLLSCCWVSLVLCIIVAVFANKDRALYAAAPAPAAPYGYAPAAAPVAPVAPQQPVQPAAAAPQQPAAPAAAVPVAAAVAAEAVAGAVMPATAATAPAAEVVATEQVVAAEPAADEPVAAVAEETVAEPVPAAVVETVEEDTFAPAETPEEAAEAAAEPAIVLPDNYIEDAQAGVAVVEEISSDADTAAADTATDDADNDKPTA